MVRVTRYRACSLLYSFSRSFKKDGYIKKEGGGREGEMEVGAIQSRRLRGKNEIHSSGERDPDARWWCGGKAEKSDERGSERAR